MASSIDPLAIPTPSLSQDGLFTAWQQLQTQATNLRTAASGAQNNWRGLAHVYKAPESGLLLQVMDLPATQIQTIASDLDTVADALWNFAVDGGAAAKTLQLSYNDAVALKSKTDADDKWDHDQGLIDQNNNIRHSVNTAVVQFMAAERACANRIEALIGGTQLHVADKDHPDGYGPASIPDDSKTPWGSPVAHNDSAPCGSSLWFTQQEVKVVEGVGEAIWGTLKGLVTLGEVGITKQSRTAWLGVATLLGAQGQQAQTQADLALVKGLVDSKEWGTDPAKALGETLFNVGTLVIPAGAVAKLGKLGDLGDLAKLGKVGDAGAVAKTLETIAKLREGGNFTKIRIIAGKIHIGDITIGSDGSKIIENGLKDVGHTHGGGHVPNVHTPGDSHVPGVAHDPTSPHSPTGTHGLPDKNAVASTKHLPATDPAVAKQVAQVDHAVHPHLQQEADQAWHSANDSHSQRWHDYQAAHGGKDPSKAVVGSWAHHDLDKALTAKADKLFPRDSGYRVRAEASFDTRGGPADYGAKGSLRPDIVIERHVVAPDGEQSWEVVQVYDLKTGARGLSTRWVKAVSKAFGIDKAHIDVIRPQ